MNNRITSSLVQKTTKRTNFRPVLWVFSLATLLLVVMTLFWSVDALRGHVRVMEAQNEIAKTLTAPQINTNESPYQARLRAMREATARQK